MKLNKDVCQICMAKDAGQPWSGEDDVRWDRREVYCKPSFVTNLGEVWHRSCHADSLPPDWCRYPLEHVVTYKPRLWERVWNVLGKELW